MEKIKKQQQQLELIELKKFLEKLLEENKFYKNTLDEWNQKILDGNLYFSNIYDFAEIEKAHRLENYGDTDALMTLETEKEKK